MSGVSGVSGVSGWSGFTSGFSGTSGVVGSDGEGSTGVSPGFTTSTSSPPLIPGKFGSVAVFSTGLLLTNKIFSSAYWMWCFLLYLPSFVNSPDWVIT